MIDDDDSEKDEGFVSNTIQIQQNQKNQQKNSIQLRPDDFQPRYINAEGIIRKEPYQIYQPISYAIGITENNTEKGQKNKTKIEQLHPYYMYFTNPEYKLIYSRNKQRQVTPSSDYFCSKYTFIKENQIALNCVSKYDSTNYTVLRPYEESNILNRDLINEQLQFDSRFESGNLQWAFKQNNKHSYILFTQNDTNSYGYNQWFYFSIRNVKSKTKYQFRIVNFKKKYSFFKQGKKIAVFSKQQQLINGKGWSYMGQNIKYQKSTIKSAQNLNNKYYCLSFDLTFENQNDHIFVALNLPYSYSKLINNLTEIQQKVKNQKRLSWQLKTVAYSLGNNAVPQITLSSPTQKKKMILILGRQHPGQTWSSYLMQQIIRGLVDGSQQSQWLLSNYIIKIFPMINVDGVIYGNSRCDLAGFDLNRNWKVPSKLLHPQNYAIKELIQGLTNKYQIQCFLDLHGHGKQFNTFCYSCKNLQKNDNTNCRILPYIFSQLNDGFYFPFCTFGISKYKETTARATFFNMIKTQNVLTIQCSFYGKRIFGSQTIAYDPQLMKQMSKTVINGLKIYFNNQQMRTIVKKKISSNLKQILEYEINNGDQAGSESDPSGDEISLQQKIGKIFHKSITTSISSNIYKKLSKRKKRIPRRHQSLDLSQSFKRQSEKPKVQKTALLQNITKNKKNQDIIKNQNSKQIKQTKQITNRNQIQMKKQINKFQTKKIFKSKFDRRNSKILQPLDHEIRSGSLDVYEKSEMLQIPKHNSFIIPLNFKNQSSESERMHDGLAIFNNFKTISQKKTLKEEKKQKRIFFKSDSVFNEQFPPLNFVSQGKRRIKKRIIYQGKPFLNVPNQHSTSSKRAQMYKKTQRQKQNSQFLSKIWQDNIAKYGKKLTIFMGDTLDDYL